MFLISEKFTAKKIIEKYNNTDGLTGLKVGNTYISMHFVYYLKFNHSYEKIKSIASKSRFEDNEELRLFFVLMVIAFFLTFCSIVY